MSDPCHPFAILLVPAPGAHPLVVASADTADRATIAFHAEWQRLMRERAQGEVSVRHRDPDRLPLLRVRLSEPAAPGPAAGET
jgi:hypothetical protein